jgi:hypothetical protein
VEEWGAVTPTVPDSREEAVALLLEALSVACPAGDVRLTGSLGRPGDADAWSDIDLRWALPADRALGQLGSLRSTLHRVGTVESLRVDPEPRRDWILVFVRFQGWPLWWRVDLEIHASGLGSKEVPEADPWSPYESACMGVVVTLKALARDRPDTAEDLLAGARQRVGAPEVAGDWAERLDSLLDELVTRSPSTADLVSRTRDLARDVLRPEPPVGVEPTTYSLRVNRSTD